MSRYKQAGWLLHCKKTNSKTLNKLDLVYFPQFLRIKAHIPGFSATFSLSQKPGF